MFKRLNEKSEGIAQPDIVGSTNSTHSAPEAPSSLPVQPSSINQKTQEIQNQAARILQRNMRHQLKIFKEQRLLDAAAQRVNKNTKLIHTFFRGDNREPSEVFRNGFTIKPERQGKGISVSPHFEPAAAYPFDAGIQKTYVYVMLIDTHQFSHPYSEQRNLYTAHLWSRDALARSVSTGITGLSDSEKNGSILIDSTLGKCINTLTNPIEVRVPQNILPEYIIGAFTVQRLWNVADDAQSGGEYRVTCFNESDYHTMDRKSGYSAHYPAVMDYIRSRLKIDGQRGKITMGTPIRYGWHSSNPSNT